MGFSQVRIFCSGVEGKLRNGTLQTLRPCQKAYMAFLLDFGGRLVEIIGWLKVR